MRSSIAGTLAAVLGLALALGAAREAAATQHGACAVLGSPFTLAEIVEKAETAVPGDAIQAGFTVQPTGGEGPETLFKVKVRKQEGGRALLFYDTETGERVLPVRPVLSLLEAYDRAVEAVEDYAGQGGAVVLKGALHRKVFVAHWDFGIADPEAVLVIARVDALTGAVRLLTPKDVAKKIVKHKLDKRRRIYRHVSGRPFHCDGLEDPDEPEDEALLDG
jgi:hypothetical protein